MTEKTPAAYDADVVARERDSALKVQRTLVRRAENYEAFPITALEAVVQIRRCLDEVEKRAVESARANGAAWSDLAEALGVTRQALYQKYRSLNGASPGNP